MPDYTDLELAKMEKQLNKIYKQAQSEIQEKWDKYMAKAQPKVDKVKAAAEAAMLDPNIDLLKAQKLNDAYQKAMLNMTLQNKHYQAMVDQVTDKLTNVNQIALDYLNGQMPEIYCHNFNEFANEKIKGYSFELVNEETVKNLIKDGNKSLLPQKTINIPKDKKWNTKNINSQVLQGILQGESIDKISKRLQNVTDMNYNAAVRNARTMTTGAENKGRQDSFVRATNDGIIIKRRWVAAHDARLRDWHADLDGVEVDVDKPFENDYGQIMYPGDPTAHPANVYNCRCSIRAVVKGFKPVEKPVGIYAQQYKDVGMTKQYYAMLDENKALGNEFWKTLKTAGKPSEVWSGYILGTGSKTVAKQLDDVLAKYKGTGNPIKPGSGKKAAKVIQKPKPDLGMYQDKSMTATYYSVKAEDKALGKEFWDVIQTSPSPSVTWNQYLIGTAPQDITEKLDAILLQHKGTGAWSKPVSAKAAAKKAAKAADAGDDLLKYKKDLPENLIDVKNITFSQDEDTWENIKGIIEASKTDEKTLAKYWYEYIKGDVENIELDKILLPQFTKMAKADAKIVAKAAAKADDLLKAKNELAVAQGNLDSLGNKTYTGIWKEPVTLADYEAKAGSIQAKKDYYFNAIKMYDDAEEAAKSQFMKGKLAELDEFEAKGKIYAQYTKEYKLAAKKVKDLTPIGDTFGPDAYAQFRKDNAVWAKSGQQADDVLREVSGEVWRNAKSVERSAIYEYTSSYSKFNEPLRGIEYGSNAYKGVGKTDLNAGYKNNGKNLNAMTDIIDKAALPQDQWFQRGCSYSGMDKFFACDSNLLRYGTQEELEKELLGKTVTEYGFMSMGSAKGQGFSGNILMNIYAPEGTKAMYVEPFSAFGHGSGKSWDGISKQGSFGGELETILQQNTDFRITKIERKSDTLYFDLEIIAQNEPQRWVP